MGLVPDNRLVCMVMTRIPLPFTVDWEGRLTHSHPAIYVRSSFSGLKPDVEDWLDENVTEDGWRLVKDDVHNDCLILEFDNDADAMLFLVKWS